MLVLQETIKYFGYVELINSKQRQNRKSRIWMWCKILVLSILEMFLVLPSANFFIANITNMMKATASLYAVCGFSVSAGMYMYFIYRKEELNELFANLEEIVNKSRSSVGFMLICDFPIG